MEDPRRFLCMYSTHSMPAITGVRVDGVTRCTHAIGGAGPSGAFLRHPKTVLLPQDTRTLGATIQPSAQCALQAVAATGRFGGGGRWDDGFLNQDVLVNVNVASICNLPLSRVGH